MRQLTDAFIKKNAELSFEFDSYIVRHPEIQDQIPNHAWVIITIKGDDVFNAQSISIVRDKKRKKVVEAQKSGSRWTVRPLALQSV